MFKKDSVWIGLAIGFLIPAIFFYLTNILVNNTQLNEHTQSFLYILGIGINALIMRYDMNHGYNKTGMGILLVSFVFAFLFIYYKLHVAS
jgi:hypothetical protein